MKNYLQKQLDEKRGKIVWLASYPKSGNTWFRCFLAALFNGEVDLETLKTDGIFSSRPLFDAMTGVDSRFLFENEIQEMIPEVYRRKAKYGKKLQFVKAHDAFVINYQNKSIFPEDVTHKVIYFVRNPLDIVASFANHNATSISDTINLMNNRNASIPNLIQGLNLSNQIRQKLMDWSGHVQSWNDQDRLDVILVKYEDMLQKGEETFSKIMSKLEFEVKNEDILRSIRMTEFSKLKKNEMEKGFNEKNVNSESFFRSGKSGSYHDELTKEQIEGIKRVHKKVMLSLQYL